MAQTLDAAARLARWLSDNDLSTRDAAKALGVTHTAISCWSTGRRIPIPTMRRRIAIFTSGAVPAEAWPVREGEVAAARDEARVKPFEARR